MDNLSESSIDSCNKAKYNFNGSMLYYEYLGKDFHSISDGEDSWSQSGPTGLSTDGKIHHYTFNATNTAIGKPLVNQDYGLVASCTTKYCNGSVRRVLEYVAFRIAIEQEKLRIKIKSPLDGNYYNSKIIDFNVSANKNLDMCRLTLVWVYDWWQENFTMVKINPTLFGYTNPYMAQGNHTAEFWCNDTSNNINDTEEVKFVVDMDAPLINYSGGTPANNSKLAQNWIYVNVSVSEVNFANATFYLFNATSLALVDETTFTHIYSNGWTNWTRINWTNLDYTNYAFKVDVRDRAGNSQSLPLRWVNLSY